MGVKQIEYNENASHKIFKGQKLFAWIVKITLGPKDQYYHR